MLLKSIIKGFRLKKNNEHVLKLIKRQKDGLRFFVGTVHKVFVVCKVYISKVKHFFLSISISKYLERREKIKAKKKEKKNLK